MRIKKWVRNTLLLSVLVGVFGGYISVGNHPIAIESRDALRDYTGTRAVQDWRYDVENYSGIPEEKYHEQPIQGVLDISGLPTFVERDKFVRENGLYVEGRRQIFGTCVFESYENIKRQELRGKGLVPPVDTIIDIDNSYYDWSWRPSEDLGSIPLDVANRFMDTGLYRNYLPSAVWGGNYSTEFVNWRTKYQENIRFVDDYLVRLNYKIKDQGFMVLDLYDQLQKCPECTARISIRNTNKVRWYNVEVPSIIGMDRLDSSGGHSVAINGAYGVFQYENEPAVYVIESYGSARYHIVKLSVLSVILTSWEIYEPTSTKFITVPEPETSTLSTGTFQYGDNNEGVKELQKFLINEGYASHTPTTYFGNVTVAALRNWLAAETGTWYSGRFWGSISRAAYVASR